jgi:hypothetical protein
MTHVLAGLLMEAFLRGALKTATTLRVMDSEGRTQMTEQEEADIRSAADEAAAASRAIGNQL